MSCLQNRAFLFLYDSVNSCSKMEQGPAITVPDWQFRLSQSAPIENLTFNGVQMKKRIFVLSLVLVGCASTEVPTNIDKLASSKTGLVELFVEQKTNAIELSCSPVSEDAGKSVVWVKQCNELAVQFLNDQIKNGVEFQVTINDKPFGMAGDFVGQMLLAHPSNFKAFSLAQTFSLKINKA